MPGTAARPVPRPRPASDPPSAPTRGGREAHRPLPGPLGAGLLDTIARHPYVPYAPRAHRPSGALPVRGTGHPAGRVARRCRRLAGGERPVGGRRSCHGPGAEASRRALSARPAAAAPVAARDAVFTVWGATVGPPEVVEAGMAMLGGLVERLRPWSTGLTYTNFAGRDDRAENVFTDADLARLRRLKRQYDPRNLFRVNNHTVTAE
ncbi:BBE domain-containing protein [Streptomyces sp. L7]